MRPKSIEKRITLGFKIMSGYYIGGISRIDISELSDSQDIVWGSMDLENTLNEVGRQILTSEFFRFWNSWNISIMDVMSDAVALNYLLMMRKDWDRKSRPITPSSSNHKAFIKNAIILLDRSIYEYITKKWRGSSDSRIASNLQFISSNPDELLTPVKSDDWNNLISEVIDDGTIEGQRYTERIDKRIKLLLYYYYTLESIEGPGGAVQPEPDLDHIIPQSLFHSCPTEEIKIQCHNIVNLAFLPKRENISKSDKRLDQITDNWLISQIERYEEIRREDFSKFSEVGSIEDLKEYRGGKIKHTFNEDRKRRIEN